jgi:hypothetical protein
MPCRKSRALSTILEVFRSSEVIGRDVSSTACIIPKAVDRIENIFVICYLAEESIAFSSAPPQVTSITAGVTLAL